MKTPQSSKPLLIIDGDILLYKTLLATQVEYTEDGDEYTYINSLTDFKRSVGEQIDNLLRELKTDSFCIALSDDLNFRKEVYPGYKANRKDVVKPVGFKAAKRFLAKEYMTVRRPGLEADDVMGITATKPDNIGGIIIVSDDKDMRTIPGRLYRNGTVEEIDVEEADMNFFVQVLTGDSTDNYPGCPGIGPKKAMDILAKPGETWENIVRAYASAGLTENDAVTQARLARILRWEDWDTETKKPKLWTPERRHDEVSSES